MRLVELPVELLTLITNSVSSQDLANIRLTSKRLLEATNRCFALKYFRTRNHVLSSHSLNALVEIANHPFFRPFIETIMLNGILVGPVEWLEKRSQKLQAALSEVPNHSRFNRLLAPLPTDPEDDVAGVEHVENLEKVFRVLNAHRKHASIGMNAFDTTNAKGCYGLRKLLTLTPDQSWTYDLFKPMSYLIQSAARSGCSIRCIKMDFEQNSQLEMHFDHLMYKINDMFRRGYVASHTKFPSLMLRVVLDGGRKRGLDYNQDTGTLQIYGLDDWTLISCCNWTIFIQTLIKPRMGGLKAMLSTPVTSLEIYDCNVDELPRFRDQVLVPYLDSLKSIKMHNIRMHMGPYWSNIIKLLAGARIHEVLVFHSPHQDQQSHRCHGREEGLYGDTGKWQDITGDGCGKGMHFLAPGKQKTSTFVLRE